MADAQKIFLLSCECTTEIEIVTGQAGGSAGCPACGRQVEVPNLRDFSALRTKVVATPPRTLRWDTPHAVAAAALAVAVVSWAGAAVVGSLPKAAFTREEIRSGVQGEDDLVLYQVLQDLSSSSVVRLPLRQEYELQRRARVTTPMKLALTAIGCVAAIVALGGLAVLAVPKRS